MKKQQVLNKLKELKPIYMQDGIEIIGLFGSYATESNTETSDIDIAYKIDHKKFSQKYMDGFSKILKLDAIKDELEKIFNKRVDFISDSNKKILKDIINV